MSWLVALAIFAHVVIAAPAIDRVSSVESDSDTTSQTLATAIGGPDPQYSDSLQRFHDIPFRVKGALYRKAGHVKDTFRYHLDALQSPAALQSGQDLSQVLRRSQPEDTILDVAAQNTSSDAGISALYQSHNQRAYQNCPII